jgi:hypothetical protein
VLAGHHPEVVVESGDAHAALDRGDVEGAGQLDAAERTLELADLEVQVIRQAEVDVGVGDAQVALGDVGLDAGGDPVADVQVHAQPDPARLEGVGGGRLLPQLLLAEARRAVLELRASAQRDRYGRALLRRRRGGGQRRDRREQRRSPHSESSRDTCHARMSLPTLRYV